MNDVVNDKAIEDGAKAVHEAFLGSGTWQRASSTERSRSRHAVRLVIAALSKNAAPAKQENAPPSELGTHEVADKRDGEDGRFRDDQW